MENNQEYHMPNRQFSQLMAEVLQTGKAFRFQASGFSMDPFIKDGDILTLVGFECQKVRIGDILAFHHPFHGKLTVHRIVNHQENQILMKPDNGEMHDGWISLDNVIGKVQSIERNGTAITVGVGWGKWMIAYLSRKNKLTPTIGFFWRFLPISIKRKIKGV